MQTILEKGLLWDIKDRAPVVAPKILADTDAAYDAALLAMPLHLQRRWVRCVATSQVILLVIENGRELGYSDDI